MTRLYLAALALLLCVTTANAQYPIGVVNVDGYTFKSDGYFWRGGQRYTYTRHAGSGYYANGCYYPTYYLSYSLYVPPVPAVPLSLNDLKLAGLKIKSEDLANQVQACKGTSKTPGTFEAFIKDLGLQGNPEMARLAQQYYGYTVTGTYNHVIAPVNATTLYGASLKRLAGCQYYGDEQLTRRSSVRHRPATSSRRFPMQAQQTESDVAAAKARQLL